MTSPFAEERAAIPLRVTCYGSSSSQTPEKYLHEAYELGYLLAKRGHTCVNGAGSFGCMAAMNDGAVAGNGHIVGVIHEMWLVDQQDWQSSNAPLQEGRTLRDGGAHSVFDAVEKKSTSKEPKSLGPIREMLVAGGKDLQERKRLLVENAQALVVLLGGPGTWDELWEAACARNIGLETSLPIVCVNVDNFYMPFRGMLQRAYDDQLTKLKPDEIVHFEETAEGAIRWIEAVQEQEGRGVPKVLLSKRASVLRETSFIGGGTILDFKRWSSSLRRSFSLLTESHQTLSDRSEKLSEPTLPFYKGVLVFSAGLATGFYLNRVVGRQRY
jgi:uncharacterized protein (TIGR00730 family)